MDYERNDILLQHARQQRLLVNGFESIEAGLTDTNRELEEALCAAMAENKRLASENEQLKKENAALKKPTTLNLINNKGGVYIANQNVERQYSELKKNTMRGKSKVIQAKNSQLTLWQVM